MNGSPGDERRDLGNCGHLAKALSPVRVRLGVAPQLRRRLGQMGIHPGDIVTVLRYGALGGPILIEVHGFQVALGRGIASRILVEDVE